MTLIAAKNRDLGLLVVSFSLRSAVALMSMMLVVVVVVVVVVAVAVAMLYPLATQPLLQKLGSFFSEAHSSLTKALSLVAVKFLGHIAVLNLNKDLDHTSAVMH